MLENLEKIKEGTVVEGSAFYVKEGSFKVENVPVEISTQFNHEGDSVLVTFNGEAPKIGERVSFDIWEEGQDKRSVGVNNAVLVEEHNKVLPITESVYNEISKALVFDELKVFLLL